MYALYNNRLDAEDLMQTTWLKSYIYYQKKQPSALTKKYFATVAKNTWIDEVRKKKLPTMPYDDNNRLLEGSTHDTSFFNISQVLDTLVSSLTINQQITFLLADVCRCSLKEIALLTGLSVGAVKATLFRARQKVKDYVRENIDENHQFNEEQILRVHLYSYALQTGDLQLLASMLTDNASIQSLYGQQQMQSSTMQTILSA